MTTADLRDLLDTEASAAIQAYIDAMHEMYGVQPVEARVSLRRAITRSARADSA